MFVLGIALILKNAHRKVPILSLMQTSVQSSANIYTLLAESMQQRTSLSKFEPLPMLFGVCSFISNSSSTAYPTGGEAAPGRGGVGVRPGRGGVAPGPPPILPHITTKSYSSPDELC